MCFDGVPSCDMARPALWLKTWSSAAFLTGLSQRARVERLATTHLGGSLPSLRELAGTASWVHMLQMCPHLLTVVLALLLSWWMPVSRASADGPWGPVSSSLLHGAQLRPPHVADNKLDSSVPSVEDVKPAEARGARGKLLVGPILAPVGLALAGSGSFMAVTGGRRRYCNNVDGFTRLKSPVYLGVSVAALGVGALVAGAILLATGSPVSRRARPILSWRLPTVIAGALAGFVVASTLQLVATAPEWVPCVSS